MRSEHDVAQRWQVLEQEQNTSLQPCLLHHKHVRNTRHNQPPEGRMTNSTQSSLMCLDSQ
ncbi:hypothetical protein E2C01_079868 [Portunus trituberculatus]|uniref:Uncharacterized protein n=1 Tax=Portunus trituberculatus TaxID=210409 RepID=A0A5B7ISG2_PORTR|nr:hypothetical protein [Portunus trituberculatus]